MPLGAAAKVLGISATALKKACRKLGNSRWPVKLPPSTPPAALQSLPAPVRAAVPTPSYASNAPPLRPGSLQLPVPSLGQLLPSSVASLMSQSKEDMSLPLHLLGNKHPVPPNMFWRDDWYAIPSTHPASPSTQSRLQPFALAPPHAHCPPPCPMLPCLMCPALAVCLRFPPCSATG